MTLHPIHNLSPPELRGYARGLRETAALQSLAWVRTGQASGELAAIATLTREAWEREADLVEGFAARLERAAPASDQPQPVTRERVAAWAARFEAAALRSTAPAARVAPDTRWYALAEDATRYRSLADAMQDEACAGLSVVPVLSSEWPGIRWAVAGDDGEPVLADTREEALSYAADMPSAEPDTTLTPEEAAQDGLADAVAEGAATPLDRPQRSDSPWTPERLALLRRLYPTLMTTEAIRQAVNALDGPEIPTTDAVKMKAQRLDLHRRGDPIPAEYADATPVRVKNLGGLAGNGGKPGTWTAERMALLRRDYPGKRALADLLADVNQLPGPAVPTIGALCAQAKKHDLSRRIPVAVGEPIAPKGEAFIPLTTEDRHEIREKLRTGAYKGAAKIAEDYGCDPDEALALVDEHLNRKGKAA